jgi:protocatechuate 3,4-dioxygenase beta subunit
MLRRFAPLVLLTAAAPMLGAAPSAAEGCPSSNPPNMLELVAGSTQTAQLRRPFQTNLQARLANSNGCPVTGNLAGTPVELTAPASGAGGTFASSGSSTVTVGADAAGVAVAPAFTANDTPGSYRVQAHSAYGTVDFSLTNTAAGVPASIAATGQASQSAAANTAYAAPLQALVLDAAGKPVPGVTVAFSLGTGTSGAGAFFLAGGAQATAVTSSAGLATSPPFTANGTPGRFTATASSAELSAVASYELRNRAALPTITAVGPASQTATVRHRYGRPLQARVLDAEGRPVEGATVTFAVDAAGDSAGATFVGGGTQATALTDENGLSSSPRLVANSTAGRFGGVATTAGAAKPLVYSFRNAAAKPAAITAGAAGGQSTTVGTRFPVPLAVTVTDAYANPVAGALVTFTAPAGGPSGRFARSGRRVVRVKTNRSGVAVAPALVANARPGGFAVAAGVRGTSRRAAFALVNRPR